MFGDVPLSLDEITRLLPARASRQVEVGDASNASVAAVFRDGARGAELLFIRRAPHPKDPWSGQIAFPGGREEPQDRSFAAIAVRETCEELGLDLSSTDVHKIGALDQIQARSRMKIAPLIIHPFAFALRGDPVFPRVPNDEVDQAFWFPLADLLDPGRRFFYDAHRATVPYTFPAIDLGPGRTLWGLTHRMVFEIKGRLGLAEDIDRLTMPKKLDPAAADL